MKAFISHIDYKVIALGGAGSGIIKHLKSMGFPNERVLYFDTDRRDIDTNGLPNRFLLGEDLTKGKGTQGRADLAKRIFDDNRDLFSNLLTENCLYIIVGGMCGGTFSAMATQICQVLYKKKKKFIVVSVMPDGQSRAQSGLAFETLEAINAFTDKVLLMLSKLVKAYLSKSRNEDGYSAINKQIANFVKDMLSDNQIRLIKSSNRDELALIDNFERIKAYVEGHDWYVAHKDASIILANTNKALLTAINTKPQDVFLVSPRKFEELTAFIYQETGYETELTKATRDEGVDIKVKTMPALRGTPFLTVIQAKQRKIGKIARYEIQQLEGAKAGAGADRAAFVSTANYTIDSIKYAKGQNIDLISFFDLAQEYSKLRNI